MVKFLFKDVIKLYARMNLSPTNCTFWAVSCHQEAFCLIPHWDS